MASFTPGRNIAMKLPERVYAETLGFYRDTLDLKVEEIDTGAKVAFGEMTLWLDRIAHQSQTDIWLEVCTDDLDAGRGSLRDAGHRLCPEVEPLPEGFRGDWVAAPSGTIHLISENTTRET